MSRIGIIGDNSLEYIETLIDIWNDGDCAVLFDKNIPHAKAVEMIREAGVQKCFVDDRIFKRWDLSNEEKGYIVPYHPNTSHSTLLTENIYNKFQINYSSSEAVILYSSGTTGTAKGIILSHFAINTNADAIIEYMNLTSKDCIYLAKPLYHSSTLTGELLVALKTRIKLVVSPVIVPPRFILNQICTYKASILCLNPYLLELLVQGYYKNKSNFDISSLKKIYVSGSVLYNSLREMARCTFQNVDIFNVYGLSEAGPRVSAQRDECCNSNSVGKPVNGVKVIIVREDGKVANEGEYGIVHISTPCVYNGYISGITKNKTLYKDWLNTGDIGFWDEFGELHIVGRCDDIITINSHKIFPSDIETVISNSFDINACVVSKTTKNGREFLCCVYEGAVLSYNEFVEKIKDKLLPYEIPRYFVQCNNLPRNANGKISREAVTKLIVEQIHN